MSVSTDKAAQTAKQALQRLEEQLKAGHSQALTQYLSAMSRFHNYSWNNVLLIHYQKPDCQKVAGYQTWKKMGRQVKAGSKGILILVPIKARSRRDDEQPRSEQDDSVRAISFIAGHVFDISDTQGDPLPSFSTVQGEPGLYLQRLRELYQEKGIRLEYSERLGGAKGASSGGKVSVLQGMELGEEFAVLAHELAHELLHRGPRREQTDTRTRETEAEAVSFVVTTAVGLENGTASSDYIQLYQGNPKLLSQSLSFIQHVSAEILDFLL